MSYKLPVIATKTGGIPEVVEDGISGFLISPGDYVDLAEKIDLLAKNPELIQKMGQNGYKIVKNKFAINVITQKLDNFYQELMS